MISWKRNISFWKKFPVTRLNPTKKKLVAEPRPSGVGIFPFPSQHRGRAGFQHAKMQDHVSNASEYLGESFCGPPDGCCWGGGRHLKIKPVQNGENFFLKNRPIRPTTASLWNLDLMDFNHHSFLTSPPAPTPLHVAPLSGSAKVQALVHLWGGIVRSRHLLGHLLLSAAGSDVGKRYESME